MDSKVYWSIIWIHFYLDFFFFTLAQDSSIHTHYLKAQRKTAHTEQYK